MKNILFAISVLLFFTAHSQQPSDVSGLSGWFKADSAFVELDAEGKVSKWLDASGNGLELVQTAKTSCPVLVNAEELNNQLCLRFDGVNDYLNGGDILDIGSKGQTVFLVGRALNDGYYFAKSLYGGVPKRSGLRHYADELLYLYHGSSVVKAKVDVKNGDFELIQISVDKGLGLITLAQNDKELLTVESGTSFDMDSEFDYLIGAYNNASGTTPPADNLYFKGEVSEVIVYDRLLSKQELFVVENYLDQKYFPAKFLPSEILLIDSLQNSFFCPVKIGVSGTYEQYLWSTGSASDSIEVNKTEKYYVTVENVEGSKFVDSVVVEFPDVEGFSEVICLGDSVELSNYLESSYDYIWSTGSNEEGFFVANSGEYSCTITDAEGCDTIVSFNVKVDSLRQEVYLPLDTALCKNNYLLLSIDTLKYPDCVFEWNGGGDGVAVKIVEAGRYSVRVIDGNSCVAELVSDVEFSGEAPEADFSVLDLCINTQVKFEDLSICKTPIVDYKWEFSNGMTSDYMNPFAFFSEGWQYGSLTVTEENGCFSQITKEFYVGTPPQAIVNFENTCVNKPFVFTATVEEGESPVESVGWYMDESLISDRMNDSFVVDETGEFEIKFVTEDRRGCRDTAWGFLTVIEDANLPEFFSLSSPYNGTVQYSDSILFRWTVSKNADSYRLVLSEDPDFKSVVYTKDGIKKQEQWVCLPFDGVVYWKVIAKNLCMKAFESEVYLFQKPSLLKDSDMWLVADSINTDSLVTEWPSLGATPLSLFADDLLFAPILADSALNGHCAVLFDGTQYLNGGDVLDEVGNGYTFFVIGQSFGSGTFYAKSLSSVASKRHSLVYNSSGQLQALFHDSEAHKVLGNQVDGEYSMYRVIFSDSLCLYTDRILDGSVFVDDEFDMNSSYDFLVGAHNNTNGTVPPILFLNGAIAEMIVFQRELSIQEQLQIEFYLQNKYFPEEASSVLDLGPDIFIEYGFADTVISAPQGFVSYVWSTGSESASAVIDTTGYYTLTVTDKYGLEIVDDIYIEYPKVSVSDKVICLGDSVALHLPFNSSDYAVNWSHGSSADTIWVNNEMVLSVSVVDSMGNEFISKPVEISVDRFSTQNMLADKLELCSGNRIIPEIGDNLPLFYEWSGGSKEWENEIETAGTYNLFVENQNACVALDTVVVDIKGIAPVVNIGSDTACFGKNTNLVDLSQSVSPIVFREWTVEDKILASSSVTLAYTFDNYGESVVRLDVKTEDGCSDYVTDTIRVGEKPVARFDQIRGNFSCAGASLLLVDNSTVNGDSISTYMWKTPDSVYYEIMPEIVLAEGKAELSLIVGTEYSCYDTTSQLVNVLSVEDVPCSPFLDLPQNNAVVSDSEMLFEWENVCNSQLLLLEIAKDSLFSLNKQEVLVSPEINSYLMNFEENADYWWRLKAFNACKDSVVSDVRQFTLLSLNEIRGLSLWLSADSVVVDDAGAVSEWTDMSGRGNDAIQLVAEHRPKRVDSALNFLPAVRFDGLNDFLIGKNLYIDEENLSIFIVHKYSGTREGKTQYILNQAGDAGNKYFLYSQANNNFQTAFNVYPPSGGAIGSIGYGADFYRLTTVVSSKNITKLFSNGSENAVAPSENYVGIETEFVIGNRYSDLEDRWFAGDIAEMLIFDRALTNNERLDVEKYLFTKYRKQPVNLGPDVTIKKSLCDTVLYAGAGYGSYKWSDGSVADSIVALWGGNYSVTATDAFGLASEDELLLTRDFTPLHDTAVCIGDQLFLEPSKELSYKYLWSNGNKKNTVSVVSSSVYSLTINDHFGCELVYEPINVLVDRFSLEVGFDNDEIKRCSGEKVFPLSDNKDSYQYTWQDSSSLPYYEVEENEMLFVRVENEHGCVGSDSVKLDVSGSPLSSAFSADTVCLGSKTRFSVLSEPVVEQSVANWFVGSEKIGDGLQLEHVFEDYGIYEVTLVDTSVHGCVSQYSGFVEVLPSPVAGVETEIVCGNEEIKLLDASQPVDTAQIVKWEWSADNFSSLEQNPFYVPLDVDAAMIKLVVTNSFGCTDSLVKEMEFVNDYFSPILPDVLLPKDSARLLDSVVLFEWSNSVNTNFYKIELSADKDFANYKAYTVYNGDEIEVPVPSGGEYYWRMKCFSVCKDSVVSDVRMFAVCGDSLKQGLVCWFDASKNVALDSDGAVIHWQSSFNDYKVSQTQSEYRPQLVENSLNHQPVVRFDGTDDYLKGSALGLNSSEYSVFVVHRFSADKTSNLNTLINQQTESGSNLVIYSLANSDNTLKLQSYPPETSPVGDFAYGTDYFAVSSIIANEDSIEFWKNGQKSVLSVTANDVAGEKNFLLGAFAESVLANCFAGDLAELVIYNRRLSVSEKDSLENYLFNKYQSELDLGDDVAYSLCDSRFGCDDTFYSYLWNDGDSLANKEISDIGKFTVTVVDAFGYEQTDSIVVSRPKLIQFSDTIVCLGEDLNWPSGFDERYSVYWSTDEESTDIEIDKAGLYSFRVQDSFGCVLYSEPIEVKIDSFALKLSLVARENACDGELIYVEDPEKQAANYKWNTGSSSQTVNVTESQQYQVTVTDSVGCSVVLQKEITIAGTAPEVGLLDNKVCQNVQTELYVQGKATEGDSVIAYFWEMEGYEKQIGLEAQYVFSAVDPYLLKITAETQLGCKGIYLDTVHPHTNPIPSITIEKGNIHCVNDSVHLHTDYDENLNYRWSVDENLMSLGAELIINPKEAKDISVVLEVETSNGCENQSTDTIFVIDTFEKPSEFVLLSPHNDADFYNGEKPLFKWEQSKSALAYTFELAEDSLFQNIVQSVFVYDTIYFDAELPISRYYWRVRAFSPCNDELVSEVRRVWLLSSELGLSPELWLIADSIDANDGEAVGKWTSVFGTEPLQNNVNFQPKLKKDALNGHSVLSFDGVNDYLNAFDSFDIGSEGQTVFIVGRNNDLSGAFYAKSLYGGSPGRNALFYSGGELAYMFFDSELHKNYSNVSVGTIGLICVKNDKKSGKSRLYDFGSFVEESSIKQEIDMDTDFDFLIGAYNNASGTVPPMSDFYLNGEIAELIIYNSALSEGQVAAVNRYLAEKYFPYRNPVELGDDIVVEDFCPVVLEPDNEYENYLWSTGEQTASIQVSQSGVYSLTISDDTGFTSADSVSVIFPVNKTQTVVLCQGEDIVLDVGIDAVSYMWLDGGDERTKTVDSDGSYVVFVTDENQCTTEFYFQVSVDSLASKVYLPADTSLCQNNTITPYISVDGEYGFEWNNGSKDAFCEIQGAGDYSVQITNENGCGVHKTIAVSLKGVAPDVDFSVDRLCLETEADFSANVESDNAIVAYHWVFGNDSTSEVSDPVVVYDKLGEYIISLTVEDTDGCFASAVDTVLVTKLPGFFWSVEDACVFQPATIMLAVADSASVTSLLWDMGNGDSENGYIDHYKYENGGDYIVSLEITDSLNCSVRDTQSVSVYSSLPAPDLPRLVEPADGDFVYFDTVRFMWEGDAHHWTVRLYSDSLRLTEVVAFEELKDASVSEILPYIDTLYWQVEAYNLCGDKAESRLNYFVRYSPSFVEGNSFWLIADSVQLEDSVSVDSLVDIAGANDLYAQNESRPVLLQNQINGHASLYFDGVDDYMDGGDILDVSPAGQTVFLVASNEKSRGTYYAKSLYGGNAGRNGLFRSGGDLMYLLVDNSPKKIQIPDSDKGNRIVTSLVDPEVGQAKLFVDGLQVGAVNIESLNNMNTDFNFLFGAYNNEKGTVPPQEGFFLKGQIAEVVVFDRALSVEERKGIERYLRYKYFPDRVVEPVDLGDDIVVEYGFCPLVIAAGDQFMSYKWSNGSISPSIVVDRGGNYSVTVVDEYGVESSDEIIIEYPMNAENQKTICVNDSLQLSPGLGNAYSYKWSSGSSDEYLWVKTDGDYSLEIVDSLGQCPFFSNYSVSVDSFSMNVGLVDTVSACKWSSLCMEGGAVISEILNVWNNVDTSFCLKLDNGGWQYLVSQNQNNCVFVDSAYAILNGEAPVVQFDHGMLCAGAISSFNNYSESVTPVVENRWFVDDSLVAETSNMNYNFTTPGEFAVKLQSTEVGGCTGEDVKSVLVDSSGYFSLIVEDACVGNPSRLSIINDGLLIDSVVFWTEGGEASQIDEVLFEMPGRYPVIAQAIDGRGCLFEVSDSVTVYDEYPSPTQFDLLLPYNGKMYQTDSIHFVWDDSENVQYYKFELFNSTQAGSVPIITVDSIFTNSIRIKIPFTKRLYWSVTAVNLCGDEYVSDFGDFIIFDPSIVSGIEAWFIADSAERISNNYVFEWSNLVNDDLSVESPSASEAPLFVDDSLNGHAVLKFDGENDYFDGGDIFDISTSGKTIFIMAESAQTTASFVAKSLFGSTPGRYFVIVDGGVTLKSLFHDNANQIVASKNKWKENEFGLVTYCANRDKGLLEMYLDRISEGKTSISKTDDLNTNYNFLIGGYNNEEGTVPPYSGYFLDGAIAEIIMYNRSLSDNERSLVEEYLMKKYLPSKVHDDIVMDDQLIVPYGYCQTSVAPEYADWQVSYQWSNGSEGISTVVDEPGIYAITITDNVGIEYVDSINVVYESYPQTIEGKKLCFGEVLEWDTQLGDGHSFTWPDNSDDSVLSIFAPGEYWLQIEDTIGCSYQSDTILVEVDSLPLVDLLGDSRVACLNERLQVDVPDAVSYKWSNGETSNETFIVSDGGYGLTVTDIQGCVATDSVDFTLNGTAPVIIPSAKNTCLNDTTLLSLTVSNEIVLDSVIWYAGDTVIENNVLAYVFDLGVNAVPVKAWSADGCSDSVVAEFIINPLPDAHFMPRVACEGQMVRFYDRSEPVQGRLETNTWNIDGIEYADSASVSRLFDKPGKHYVSVSVTDSYGCADFVEDSVEVRSAPISEFVYTPLCDEQTSFFFNRVETQTYNQILDYKWSVGGTEIHSPDVYYYLNDIDSLEVSLTVKGINGCSDTEMKYLPVGKQPDAGFIGTEVCLNDTIQFADSSLVERDSIVDWLWLLDGTDTLVGQMPTYVFNEEGVYNAHLTVETDKGCVDTISKEINVRPLPQAEFVFYPKFGGAPLLVNFQNQSVDAVSYEWDVNNEVLLTDERPSYIFSNTGSFYVSLKAVNEYGCVDTVRHFINTYVSEYNILINSIKVIELDGHYTVSVDYQNLSPDAMYMLHFVLQEPEVGVIREVWEGEIAPGKSGTYRFGSQIRMHNEKLPDYVCVEIQVADEQSVYYSVSKCVSTQESVQLYDVFPNPVAEDLTVRFSLPKDGEFEITVTDAVGKVNLIKEGTGVAGYNELILDASNLASGVYFIRLKIADDIEVVSFVKQLEGKDE